MLEFKNIVINNMGFKVSASFTIQRGQKIGIIGPSGAGKSSLLAAISGFVPLQSGEMLLDGQLISSLDPSARPTSTIFQSHNLFMHLSLRQNIALGFYPNHVDYAHLDMVATTLGIQDQLEKKPRDVSGGQAARGALARTLIQNRDIWLLDEPFAALGPRQGRELRDEIDRIRSHERNILFVVSHSPDELRSWTDQIIWVDQNRCHAPVDTKTFFLKPPIEAQNYL